MRTNSSFTLILLIASHFDGVVLRCTDVPMLHHHFPISSPKPIYDSINIPAKTLAGLL